MSGSAGPGEGIPGGTAGIGRGGGKGIAGAGAIGAITGNGRAKAGETLESFACCFAPFLVFLRSRLSRFEWLDDGLADEQASRPCERLLPGFEVCRLFVA